MAETRPPVALPMWFDVATRDVPSRREVAVRWVVVATTTGLEG